MNIAEKNYEKRANDWRIIYLCNDGDIRVDTYPYKSEADAAQMLHNQITAGAYKNGKTVQSKTFFKT